MPSDGMHIPPEELCDEPQYPPALDTSPASENQKVYDDPGSGENQIHHASSRVDGPGKNVMCAVTSKF